MKIDQVKVGDTMEINGIDNNQMPIVIKFEIVEKSWYESKVKPGTFFSGAKCRFDNGAEEVLPFLTIEFARKI
jgi:hypothetical protein